MCFIKNKRRAICRIKLLDNSELVIKEKPKKHFNGEFIRSRIKESHNHMSQSDYKCLIIINVKFIVKRFKRKTVCFTFQISLSKLLRIFAYLLDLRSTYASWLIVRSRQTSYDGLCVH